MNHQDAKAAENPPGCSSASFWVIERRPGGLISPASRERTEYSNSKELLGVRGALVVKRGVGGKALKSPRLHALSGRGRRHGRGSGFVKGYAGTSGHGYIRVQVERG